jgi:two-component system LytT family response regulator
MVMNKIRTVVVDDEPVARDGLIRMLRNFPDVKVVGEAMDGAGLHLTLKKDVPDLIFLDIMLRDENVLDVLPLNASRPLVVFTTAFPQYALRGYEFNALDYLLKPIAPGDLERAVSRAQKQLLHQDAASDEVFLRINGKYHRIFYRDILFLEGMENYVVIHTETKKLVCKSTMQWFEKNFPMETFVRVHRSFIVNKNKVDMIDKLCIVLKEHQIPISRENRIKVYHKLMPGLHNTDRNF